METEEGTWTQYQKLVLRLLEQHDSRLELLSTKLAIAVEDKGSLAEAIVSLRLDIDILLDLVRDGTSAALPLLKRVDELEAGVAQAKKAEMDKLSKIKDIIAYKRALFISLFGTACVILWEIIQKAIGSK